MGKYILKKAKDGYVFNLKAANGEVIGVSEVYTSINSARSGIESVSKNAPVAELEDQTVESVEAKKNPKFEMYTDKRGETRYRLKATNGQIILTGEGYAAKASCRNGIESVRKNADSPTVEELD